MGFNLSWQYLAIASGVCAAANGLFAKLTTSTSTSVGGGSATTEVAVRAVFFGLNLGFNAIMWALFTAALAKGSSATTVSVVNTSANFMATALFGNLVFSESLPPTWWAGAALLVVGSVIISRKDHKAGAVPKDGYLAVPIEKDRGNSSGFRGEDGDGTRQR